MSKHKKSKLSILSLLQNVYRSIGKTIQRLMRSLLRTWIRMNRRDRYGRAGFVLPTVTMVLLVVVLLTIAITLRSFERAKVAQYRRVDEAVLQAATPALDRARAKLEDLLGGGNESRKAGIPTRGIPTEASLYNALTAKTEDNTFLYDFPDEERLTVEFEIPDTQGGLCDQTNLNECNQMETAWRFPVDTDNNGLYDSLTYYGIFFRTPPIGPDGEERARVPLDARTPPVDTGSLSDTCAAAEGTSASLVGDTGWLKTTSGLLKKSFFIYTVTVPITENDPRPDIGVDYENFKGSPGFSALELQQDYGREPIVNNAVIYEDDLDLSPGTEFNLNGRIVTNSNLLITPLSKDRDVKLYLVSSPASCFYTADNSKIQVAGNVVVGAINTNEARPVQVHLFNPNLPVGNEPQKEDLTESNDSVGDDPKDVLFNSLAYVRRIEALETADPSKSADDYREMTRKVPFKEVPIDQTDTATATVQDYNGEKGPELVAMLPVNDQGLSANTGLGLQINNLPATKPDDADPNFEKSGEKQIGDRILVGNNLPLRYFFNGKWQNTDYQMPIEGGEWAGSQPGRYRKSQVADIPSTGQTARDGDWEKDALRVPSEPSEGVGGVLIVTGAGVYNRGKSFLPPPIPATMNVAEVDGVYKPVANGGETFTVVWPDTMPMSPPYAYDLTTTPITVSPIPGSQVYDNSDLYDPDDGLTPVSTNDFESRVNSIGSRWQLLEDIGLTNGDDQYAKGDLRMRTTIVYHYANKELSEDEQIKEFNNDKLKVDIAGEKPSLETNDLVPIACVSSYYDPSSSFTAKNESGLNWNASATGRSNNGIVYPVPTIGNTNPLDKQARLIYPDGRLVNEALYRASEKDYEGLTLEEHAAVYSAQCSLDILDGTANPVPSDNISDDAPLYDSIPHGAIREATLLDARQAKAFDANDPDTAVDETFSLRVNPDGTVADTPELEERYRQPLENRYPLEVRVTQLDLNALRNTTVEQNLPEDKAPTVNGTEYLLPLSGIVYASRDDALPDFTDETVNKSAADYAIDPTRRPNGIMLINGERLARNDANDDGQNDKEPTLEEVVYEKGLILTSNVPVYIWGDFNLHTHEEFDEELFPANEEPNWGDFYTRKTPDPNFACRKDDPRLPNCTEGDAWRPATILSDAVTLLTRKDGNLKEGFRFGFRNEGDFDLRNNAGNVVIGGGYNFNGDSDLDDSVKESDVGLDLNENGVIETNDTDDIPETEITAKMARLLAGFHPYNDYVVNGLSSGLPFDTNENGTFNTGSEPNELYNDEDYRVVNNNNSNAANSSYFNNFVTPIQRRRNFPEYVMEICLKLPVSACQPRDWKIIIDGGTTPNGVVDDDTTDKFEYPSALLNGSDDQKNLNTDTLRDNLLSGTTAKPPAIELQRFPRRVAFERQGTGSNPPIQLKLDGNNRPIPLGISPAGRIVDGSDPDDLDKKDNALWFQNRNGTSKNWGSNHPLWYYDPGNQGTSRTFTANTQQPLLVPVLQIHTGEGNKAELTKSDINKFPSTNIVIDNRSYWLQGSSREGGTFNLVVGTGDTPPRPGEINGGLNNLPRTLENFFSGQNSSKRENLNIVGSFVQTGRSRYATAPYQAITNGPKADYPAMFGNTDSDNRGRVYRIKTSEGLTPFFAPPNRNWGFDVGLLSQTPDRYASKFAQPKAEADDYFREVSRDDPWVKALLCSKVGGNAALARNGNRVQLTGTDCSNYGD